MSASKTNRLRTLNQDLFPYGLAYDSRRGVFFSTTQTPIRTNNRPWEKRFIRRNKKHEPLSPRRHAYFDGESIPFSSDGRQWLLLLRKGQYGVATGAEVGLYELVLDGQGPPRVVPYAPAKREYYPLISLTLWRNDSPIVKRSARNWYLTGFAPGVFADPSELGVHLEITFHDAEVCRAFGNALGRMGYGKDDYQVRERHAWLVFHQPIRQPSLHASSLTEIAEKPYPVPLYSKRTRFIHRKPLQPSRAPLPAASFFSPVPRKNHVMTMNRLRINLYNRLVPHNRSSLEQLAYLRRRFPLLYKWILHSLT